MERPVVGLALGSGAAKGYAHIGVLQVLEREKIPVDIIVGSSIGSLIGALYAAGISSVMLERLAYQIRRRHWVDLSVPKKGLIAGNKIETILRLLTKNVDFEQLEIPLGVIATDLCSKKSILIREGNVALAVKASIAIPGIFCPVELEGKILVDGGVLERVPGSQARMMGADVVIGVELGFSNYSFPNNIYDILIQTFDVMGREIQALKQYDCDVLITPDLSDVDGLAFNQVEKCIYEGRKAAEKALPQIMENLRKKVEAREE
ncbi:MAG TPA: patatin family protein [Thermoanaerobacterales bacterium]|nr:patatin family protein [Thermoanaerobacterales bacterium]